MLADFKVKVTINLLYVPLISRISPVGQFKMWQSSQLKKALRHCVEAQIVDVREGGGDTGYALQSRKLHGWSFI